MEWIWFLIGTVAGFLTALGLFKLGVDKKFKEVVEKEIQGLEALKFNLSRENERIKLSIAENDREFEKKAAELRKLGGLVRMEIEEVERRKVELDALKRQLEEIVDLKGKMSEIVTRLESSVAAKTQELESLSGEVSGLIGLASSMRKRQSYELRGNRLEFEDWELRELAELEGLVGRFKNATPIYKAIYEVYYRDKIVRLGAPFSGKSGIYRIWVESEGESDGDEKREMCYVGQSVDIGARWIQHLKRMVGADEATGIKLYREAKKVGIEKLRWEVLEECEKGKLSEREKYWGEFYNVKEG